MIKKIKKWFLLKKFKKQCLHLPCTICPYFRDTKTGEICTLAKDLGL